MTVAVAHQHSATAKIALTEAAREARFRGTTLTVLNVVDSLDLDSRAALESSLTDEVTTVLTEAGLSDLDWSLVLGAEDEDVADTLIELAVQAEADVLVIGARRRSPLGKFVTGSATQSIVLSAPMPVLVVKTPA